MVGGMRPALLAALAAALAITLPTEARSRAVVAEFKRQQPCPATGKPAGPCPGWQVDHRTPLKCGGRDHVDNLQWLTVREHRAKTAREAKLRCRPSPALPTE